MIKPPIPEIIKIAVNIPAIIKAVFHPFLLTRIKKTNKIETTAKIMFQIIQIYSHLN